VATPGLGKNSPIVLAPGRSNYEALIERHGQWMRWRTAVKCPCADKNTNQSDPHCPRCGGAGFIYGHQNNITVTETVCVPDNSGIVEVSAEYADCALDFICDYDGNRYENAVKTGQYIGLNAVPAPAKGSYLYTVMSRSVARLLSEAACVPAGDGYYRVEGLQFRKTGIDGLFHTAPADIISIGRIEDDEGSGYETDEYRLDMFRLEQEAERPLKAKDIEYIPPFVFALLSQELSEGDAQAVTEANGDAVLTFPYACDVSNDDIITVLSGTYTQKEVVKRIKDTDDTIGAYFIQDVYSCLGKEREYRQGVDFLLTGTNRIKWICADAPAEGSAYSVSYHVFPTYKVMRAIPQIRTSENQRLPKKVIVKLYSTYGEKRRINRQ